jgi:hypothetical protein
MAGEWQNANIQVFWSEIARVDHLVQIYESEQVFLNTLEGYTGCSLLAGDSVIVIATPAHLNTLTERLDRQGFDLTALTRQNRFFPLDAEETLSKFMVEGQPDKELFMECISPVIGRAQEGGRKVKAFGEMVSVLCTDGFYHAAVQLEKLWNRVIAERSLTLYCAYPKNTFVQDSCCSIDTICDTHTIIIDGQSRPATDIVYRTTKAIRTC